MAVKKFLFGTDSHGDQIDCDTSRRFLKFSEDYRAHYRIHGGDVFDLRPLRPTQILKGNHDVRLWKKAASRANGLVRDLCARLAVEIESQPAWNNAQVFPYDTRLGVFSIGSLQFVHGYHSGINAARQAIATYKGTGSVIQGHVHSFSRYSDTGLNRAEGITCGLLGKIDMPYNEKTPRKLAYEIGWLFGEVVEKKSGKTSWECWFVRKDGDVWMTPR